MKNISILANNKNTIFLMFFETFFLPFKKHKTNKRELKNLVRKIQGKIK